MFGAALLRSGHGSPHTPSQQSSGDIGQLWGLLTGAARGVGGPGRAFTGSECLPCSAATLGRSRCALVQIDMRPECACCLLSPGPVWLGLFRFCLCYFRPMPRTFLYRCPNTGQNVQGWSADEVTDEDDTYQSFQCIACTRVHLVNLKTGKVLGGEED